MHQAALSGTPRCDDNVIGVIAFKCFFYPIKLNPLDTLFIQNTAEKGKNLNGDVHVKTETKLFIPNAYFAHFLDGHLTALNSHLAQDNQIFRKPFKIIASSTLKKKTQKFMAGWSFPALLGIYIRP